MNFDSLSIPELEEQIKQIEEAIHKVHLHKLISLDEYLTKIEEFDKLMADAKDNFQLKVVNSRKSLMKEYRLILKSLNDEEVRLREMKAELFARKRLHP